VSSSPNDDRHLGSDFIEFVRRNFGSIIGAIIGLALVTIVVFSIWQVALNSTLGSEVFKLLYQFLLIAVIGGIGTFLLSEHSKDKERQREERAQEQALLRDFRKDLLGAYNAAKKVRRMLRARVHEKNGEEAGEEAIEMKHYAELMHELISVQLRFELLGDEAKTLFSPSVDNHVNENGYIHSELKKMDEYLQAIVDEYTEQYDESTKEPQLMKELLR